MTLGGGPAAVALGRALLGESVEASRNYHLSSCVSAEGSINHHDLLVRQKAAR